MSDDADRTPEPGSTPPPGPWWSQPSDGAWGAPEEGLGAPQHDDNPTTVYGQPYAEPTAGPPAAEQPAGAPPAWGWPTDTIGSTNPPAGQQRRGGLAMAGAVLATALVAGTAGGFLGARGAGSDRSSNRLTDSAASLGTASTDAGAISRPPDSVAGIAARVLKSVVNISVTTGSGGGTGSGVVLRSDGYILTNNHVVAPGAVGGTITVSFNGADKGERPASIVGRDPETDLAVIKVSGGEPLVPATLGSSTNLVVGDPVVAIGSPLGLAGTVTSGIISALNRRVNVPSEDGSGRGIPLINAIQTDAAINPGNSGGALVDGRGRLIGINSAIATLGGGSTGSGTQSGSIGVGFAIPVDEARSIAEQLIRTGKATHPVIGVNAMTVGADGNGQRGAQLVEVLSGGAAQQAGLQAKDIITKLDGKPVQSVDQLIVTLRGFKVGDTITVTYVRGSDTRTAKLVLQDKKPG